MAYFTLKLIDVIFINKKKRRGKNSDRSFFEKFFFILNLISSRDTLYFIVDGAC